MDIAVATDAGWLGLASVLALVFLCAVLVSLSGLPRIIKTLAIAALFLRVGGALLRYYMIFGIYGGVGDSAGYYPWGLSYAEEFRSGNFSIFYDSSRWWLGTWWGTQFVRFISGVVLTFIGSTILGQFILFSIFAFLGLVCFAVAFRRNYPDVPLSRYVRWIWLFPSLWFWPSSTGKEAIVLAGMGFAVAGFIGRGRINWIMLSLGICLIFAIRPQVAAVVFLAFIFAYWLSLGGRWTVWRITQAAAMLVVGIVGIGISLQYIGAGGFDVEGVRNYMETDASRRVGGGSSIEAVPIGLAGIPLGIINTLFRPLPFEASNPMVLVSSLEIWFFWGIAWLRRKRLLQALKNWQTDRLTGVALPFIVIYSLALGMMVTNLGIIARQRVFLFPFLFILLEAPAVRRTASAAVRKSRAFSPNLRRQPIREGIA